jgi:hypothetical protein
VGGAEEEDKTFVGIVAVETDVDGGVVPVEEDDDDDVEDDSSVVVVVVAAPSCGLVGTPSFSTDDDDGTITGTGPP